MDIKNLSNHIILCGWNGHAHKLLQQLRVLHQKEKTCLLIISEKKPPITLDKETFFLEGGNSVTLFLRNALQIVRMGHC